MGAKTKKKVVLDSNIFLNVIFEEKEFVQSSEKFLKAVELGKYGAYVSSISVAEIVWVVQKDLGYKKAKEVFSYIKDLFELNLINIIPLDHQIIPVALQLLKKYRLSLIDSLISSVAVKIKAELITRDESLHKIKEIKVKTPDELT